MPDLSREEAERIASAIVDDFFSDFEFATQKHALKDIILKHLGPKPLEWEFGRYNGDRHPHWKAAPNWEISVDANGLFFFQRHPTSFEADGMRFDSISEAKAAAESHRKGRA